MSAILPAPPSTLKMKLLVLILILRSIEQCKKMNKYILSLHQVAGSELGLTKSGKNDKNVR